MEGIILAGGLGSRLHPLTKITNKHLLPVYDRPMIYYPIQALVNAGIDDIMIVTGGKKSGDFLSLLGNGSDFGLKPTCHMRLDGMDDLEIRGNFLRNRFDVLRDGAPVARIAKRWGWFARYQIDVAKGSDELPVFLAAMALYDVHESDTG